MPTKTVIAATIVVAVGLLAAACSDNDTPSDTASAGDSAWQMILPLGSGGHPDEPGSNDIPKWTPGKLPVTMQPIAAFNGDLWMTSQTNAWSSSNAVDWSHYAKTDTGSRIWDARVFFKGRLWSFGGMAYSQRAALNEIWSSADGTTWHDEGRADWSPRKQHAVIVYHDRLWLFGGADQIQSDFETVHTLNDVWSSDDGLHWTRMTESAPWSTREGASVVVLDDAMYMVGAEGVPDVWRSMDGANWTQVAASVPWGPRFGYAANAFDGKLWVLGGYRSDPRDALNDVWYSRDGATWTLQTEHAPWGPRDPLTVVYKDKLWIFSGKHTGGKDSWGGDLWAMAAAAVNRALPSTDAFR
ncbi:MAG: hypothetical protein E6J42_10080 [Chloroflexi bacterium]|nr:MAG: hypothetical protein E6J42_10080 [Chloroflexota bacterium]